jgi:phage RecT family recombinase
MTTDIVPLQMNYPLVATTHLANMSDGDLMVIGKAFPGDNLTDEQRLIKAETMRSQFMLYIDNVDNKKGARDAILRCVTQSIAECMLTLASIDLPLTKSLGYAALIPYAGVCTVTIMYQGLCELIYRSGTIASIQCGLVFDGDQFAYEVGTAPALRCIRGDKPATEANLTHAWSIAHNATGPDTIEVMERSELDKVKGASKMSKGPAWRDWWGQMYRKAPIRRMAKYLQTSTSGAAQAVLARALELDNSGFMLSQNEKYKEIQDANSKELSEQVSAILKAPEALPAPTEIPPPTADEDNALATIVGEMREGVDSSMMDSEFIVQVTFGLLGRNDIQSKTEFNQVWNAIVNEKAFDLETGERIPDMGEQA